MSGERVERRLTAILAADVAGHSRLMGRDEAGTFARLKALSRELIAPKIAEHKGRVVEFDLSEQQLKNMARPVRVYGVSFCAISKRASPALALPDKPSSRCYRFRTSAATRSRNISPTAWSRRFTTA